MMPSGGKRRRVGDAEMRDRAAKAGLDIVRLSADTWTVNGVTVSRRVLLSHLQRAERKSGRPFGYMGAAAIPEVPVGEMWRLARESGSTLILHTDGMVTLDANVPRPPGHVLHNLRQRAAATAAAPRANWELACRAQRIFGGTVRKRGAYWQIGNGGSYTTERLERLVAEREGAMAQAVE